jgi:hypothetical protein
LILPLLFGCESEECTQLRELKKLNEARVAEVKARAKLKQIIVERMTQFEAGAKDAMAKLGLDLPETKLKEALDARVAKVPGATVERTTKPVGDADEGGAITETVWRIRYAAKNDAEGFAIMRALAQEPPLFKVITLLKDPKGKWMLELMRASVPEVPMNIQPTQLEPLRSASEIKSGLGLCGAGDLRRELEKLEKEFAEVKAEAEELSVMMPKSATYEGLERRAQLLGELERENRRLFEAFFAAVDTAKVRFRGTGIEREVVIYEIYGGQSERQRLEKSLPEDVLRGMKELDSAEKNVIRLSVVNRVADQQIKRHSGAMRPGVGLAPEKGP